MAVTCPWLDEAGRYERLVTGWVDARPDGLLRLTARLSDHRAGVEVALDVTPSPAFDVARATGAWTAGAPGDPDTLGVRLAALAGSRIVPGFRRQVVEALGAADAFTPFAADAVIEAARLSRQVTRLDPRLVPERPSAADFRRLDLVGWPELAGMCVTYSEAAGPLAERPGVRVPATLDMYAPAPGVRFVFHRYKRTAVTLADPVLTLYQSMFDQVHGFELWYEVDVRTARVLGTRALTPRLPYQGLCDRGQGRNQALVGAVLDAGWPGALRAATGGSGGCFQLTDLSGDLFRLLRFA